MCTVYSEETDCTSSSWRGPSWQENTWSSAVSGHWVSRSLVWLSSAGSHTGPTSALISLYWIGQAMLGFTSSHRFGFTKVSDAQKYSVCYSDHLRIISPTHEARSIKIRGKSVMWMLVFQSTNNFSTVTELHPCVLEETCF